ncbi:hypothetical protein ACFP81_03150 [Deinococcus lacus]|uniref:Uncharacterized protein n=1 Tax=Deinococcus lacus TaxID=392561 RepID=A0ABW1YDY3_9DEIO
MQYALPWQQDQGRPLRLGAGYRWGERSGPYAAAQYHLGSYAVRAEAGAAGFGVKLSAVW